MCDGKIYVYPDGIKKLYKIFTGRSQKSVYKKVDKEVKYLMDYGLTDKCEVEYIYY